MNTPSPEQAPSLGIPSLDRDHEVEGHLLRALHAFAGGDEADDDTIREVICRVIDYTSIHCDSEDLLMTLYAYPETEAHQRAHAKMLEKADELLSLFDQDGRKALPSAIRQFDEWLINHIRSQDQELSRFLSKLGVPRARTSRHWIDD